MLLSVEQGVTTVALWHGPEVCGKSRLQTVGGFVLIKKMISLIENSAFVFREDDVKPLWMSPMV